MISPLSLQTLFAIKRALASVALLGVYMLTAAPFVAIAASSVNDKTTPDAQTTDEASPKAEPLIYLDENGVTIRCEGATVGHKEFVDGIEYEVVDGGLLKTRLSEGADLTRVCTSLVTNMVFLFLDKPTFNQAIGNWDVSNVTTMQSMFYFSAFNQPIGDWDVSNVIHMDFMFFGSSFNQPIGNWNVSNVTSMRSMFSSSSFNQPIGNWNVGNVTDMYNMFYYSPFNQPIGNWNVSKVTDMNTMFLNSQFNQPISGWVVSSVTDMGFMFQSSNFNQPIGSWNVGNVTTMEAMFKLSPFNQPIGNWNVSKVTNMVEMFAQSFTDFDEEPTFFNQDISNWDVKNVTEMRKMFEHSDFNKPLARWDVSNVADMSAMFYGSRFNQPIGTWNVGKVTNMRAMFSYGLFNQEIGGWDVSKVTSMFYMFFGSAFNQNLDNWVVSSVTDMSGMFRKSPFNQDIGSWNVSKVTNFEEMFESTPFNQYIGDWDVSKATNMTRMFNENTVFNQPLQLWCVENLSEPSNFSTSSLLPSNKPVWNTCPSRNASPDPTITSLSMSLGNPGQTLAVTVTGTGFVPGYTWVSFGNDIRINSFSVTSATEATANITIAASATQGARDVSVTNPTPGGGKDTRVGGFMVSVPLIYLDPNGVTIRCEGAENDLREILNGIEYWVVDNSKLHQLVELGYDLSKVCTSNVTDMKTLFINRKNDNRDIRSWDVSNVTNMSQMFEGTTFNQDIGLWNVGKVTDMSYMFKNTPFNRDIGNWNTSSVTNMSFMFEGSDFNQDIGDWDVLKVTTMSGMFLGSQFNSEISSWEVGNVTNMQAMFNKSAFNQPIGDWDVSKVADMSSMFYQGPRNLNDPSNFFNQDISNWDVSNVTNMRDMFYGSDMNQPLGTWDVSSVTDMTQMFHFARFNQPIGNWDVSNVTNMTGLFAFTPFNQDISKWDVRNVTNMLWMFRYSAFDQDISIWDVGNVTNMRAMFGYTSYNRDISRWDVSKVEDFGEMFQRTPFNQDISNWDVSSATNMNYMFDENSVFNQPLQFWCVSKISSAPTNFSTASLLVQNRPKWGTCPTPVVTDAPTITSVTPGVGSQGQTLNLTVTGSGFLEGYTTFSLGSDIQVNSVTVTNSTTSTVNITISESATLGVRNVTVTNPAPGGGTATLTNSFEVIEPAVLSVTPLTISKTAIGGTETIMIANTAEVGTLNWTAVAGDSWVTLSASSGTGDASIVATIAENTTFSARSTTIVITSAGSIDSPATITVTQDQKPQPPVITTTAATNLGGSSAVVGGNVTSQGSSAVTSRGVCYSLSPSPTITASCVTATESGTGEFNVTLAGLNALTLYYARAFAVNAVDVSYGQEITFTTLNPVPTLTSLSISSGIKGQTMSLAVNGTGFLTGITSLSFGVGIQVLSFTVLNPTTISADIRIEESAAVGPRDVTITNSAPGGGIATLSNGFTVTASPVLAASPTSFSKPVEGGSETITISNTGGGLLLWTATKNQEWVTLSANSGIGGGPLLVTLGENTNFDSRSATVVISATGAQNSPVTINIIQEGKIQSPIVTTSAATNITTTSAVLGGVVQSQGSSEITGRGVCYSTTDAPTIESSCVTSSATGTGAFTVSVSGLTQATRYYARAYAVNSVGLSYGETVSFNTFLPTPTITALSIASANQGQVLSVGIVGSGFLAGSTSVSFGDGIQVTSFTVNTANSADATIAIAASAAAGARNVSVINPAPGGGTATLNNGFTVTRPLSLEVNPLAITKGSAGGTEAISITNGGDGILTWSATVSQGWITLSANSGTGNTNITATIAENTAITQRVATITITATGTTLPTKVINVTQSGTQLAPSVTTMAATTITVNSAILGGNVTSEGSQPVLVRGVCYSVNPLPTISDTCVNAATPSLGAFTVTATALISKTQYYARAFAQNSVGISYGQSITFTTLLPEPRVTTVAPNVGSVGQTMTVSVTGTGFLTGITTVSFGDSIQVSSFTVSSPTAGSAAIVISSKAVPGTRNITVTNPAPGGGTTSLNAGFTVTALPVLEVTPATITAISTPNTQAIQIRNNGGGSMPWTAASNQSWATLSSASGTGNATMTVTVADNPLFVTRTAIITVTATGAIGSPRTVRVTQEGKSPAPVVTTAAASNVTMSSVQLGGTVTSQGASAVVDRGVCFSTSPNPSFSETCVKAATAGIGAFSINVNNINSSTLFYARAYATNSDATTYGQTVQFTTLSSGNPRPLVSSVTPTSAARGSFVDVTIVGINFASSGLSIQAGEGITVSNIIRLPSGNLTARFTVNAEATVGSRLVTVTNPAPGGGTSDNVVQFFVTLPAPTANSSNWSLGSINQKSQKPQFDWTRVTETANYTVQYSNRNTFPQITSCTEDCTEANTGAFTNTHTVNGTVFTVPTILEANTTHYWRVRANTETIQGVWSPAYSFTTIPAPLSPALLAPANGAAGLTGSVPLSWAATTNTTRYQLEVSPNIYFSPTVVAVENLTTPSFIMPAFTSASPAEFFWRVRSFGIGGNSPWSSVNTFRRAALTSDGDDLTELPQAFELLQNYPNPFNPSTTITYLLPESGKIQMRLYSVVGVLLKTLVDDQKSAGRHQYVLDASGLPSGVYIVQLQGDEDVQSIRITLIK